MELVVRTERAAARDDHLGAGELRTLRLRKLGRNEVGLARSAARIDGLDRTGTAIACCLFKGGAANGDDLLGVLRADRRNGVSGVDRPGESVRAFDRQNVR